MKKAITIALGVVFVSLSLAACGFDGKFENDGMLFFDNNCSGTGGLLDEGRCANYVNAG